MFKTIIASMGLMAATVFMLPVTAADPASITIPVSTIVRGDENSTHLLESKDVNSEMIGMVCDVQAKGENQSSVHPGNDLVIASGGDSVVLEDVERESHVVTNATGTLTLGSEITVTLHMGEDEVFSGGMDVNFNCQGPEQIEVCRDGKIVTINEDERLDTDTEAPCPEEKLIEVCRDGEIITISEDERLDTDTDACVLAEEDLPEVLPNTGPGAIAAGFIGSGALFAGARSWLDSRRSLKHSLLKR